MCLIHFCCVVDFQFVRFFSLASNETSVFPIHSRSSALSPSMTVGDMVKMMEKERNVSMSLNHIDIVTATGHIVEPTEPVASYASVSIAGTSVLLFREIAPILIRGLQPIHFEIWLLMYISSQNLKKF